MKNSLPFPAPPVGIPALPAFSRFPKFPLWSKPIPNQLRKGEIPKKRVQAELKTGNKSPARPPSLRVPDFSPSMEAQLPLSRSFPQFPLLSRKTEPRPEGILLSQPEPGIPKSFPGGEDWRLEAGMGTLWKGFVVSQKFIPKFPNSQIRVRRGRSWRNEEFYRDPREFWLPGIRDSLESERRETAQARGGEHSFPSFSRISISPG